MYEPSQQDLYCFFYFVTSLFAILFSIFAYAVNFIDTVHFRNSWTKVLIYDYFDLSKHTADLFNK